MKPVFRIESPIYGDIENASVDPRASTLIDLARALDLEIMPVPRAQVPIIAGLLRASNRGAGDPLSQTPAYVLYNDEEEGVDG
jgi:hypothetical protein